ncbi:lipocalin family protein [Hydrogenophaga sp.]|uniref:lipocalin family protein n=1 Tax=Hydrogenophaga sp. TaxID=1904254 RepID=UPI0025BF3AC2|nr:lipocalin family protein [Hydrogenophaga sp.]
MQTPLLDRLRHTLALLLLASGALLAGCSSAPPAGVSVVTPFDVNRYLGSWLEVARLDHRFERGLSRVSANYSLNDDGSVKVINRGYNAEKGEWSEAEGRAVFTGDANTGSLKVSFFGPFYGGYHVIALDPGYRWAMVIGPDLGYLWILSREAHLPPGVRERLLAQAAQAGVNTAELIWVDHSPLPR